MAAAAAVGGQRGGAGVFPRRGVTGGGGVFGVGERGKRCSVSALPPPPPPPAAVRADPRSGASWARAGHHVTARGGCHLCWGQPTPPRCLAVVGGGGRAVCGWSCRVTWCRAGGPCGAAVGVWRQRRGAWPPGRRERRPLSARWRGRGCCPPRPAFVPPAELCGAAPSPRCRGEAGRWVAPAGRQDGCRRCLPGFLTGNAARNTRFRFAARPPAASLRGGSPELRVCVGQRLQAGSSAGFQPAVSPVVPERESICLANSLGSNDEQNGNSQVAPKDKRQSEPARGLALCGCAPESKQCSWLWRRTLIAQFPSQNGWPVLNASSIFCLQDGRGIGSSFHIHRQDR